MRESTFEWPEDGFLANRSRELGLAYFVPDDAEVVDNSRGFYLGRAGTLQRVEPGTVYRARELRHLVGMQPTLPELEVLHEVKRLFGVEVTASRPRVRRYRSEEEIAALWSGWPLPRREHYLKSRLRALEWLGTGEETATLEQRTVAASWAAERALELEEGESP